MAPRPLSLAEMVLMELSTLLANLTDAGGAGILPKSATLEERKALERHLAALKAANHAVTADEVYEHGEATGEIRAFHYLSCQACARRK